MYTQVNQQIYIQLKQFLHYYLIKKKFYNFSASILTSNSNCINSKCKPISLIVVLSYLDILFLTL